jgi:ligand-binding sensor domain-containing protein/two-component sensor histidine kinase
MFIVYHPPEKTTGSFSALYQDRVGHVWSGTTNGLYLIERDGEDWKLRLIDIGAPTDEVRNSHIFNFLEDRRGALWIATYSGLYRRWPDGRTERYTTRQGLPSNAVRGLLEAPDGTIWVGTFNGLCQLKSELSPDHSIVARVYTPQDGLAGYGVNWLFWSSGGHLWVCTDQGVSVAVFSPNQNRAKFRTYTYRQGLSDLFIWCMTEDQDGNLWIGSNVGGVMKLARRGFTTYQDTDGLGSNFVNSICETIDGELCVTNTSFSGPGRYLSRFDGERFTPIRIRLPDYVTLFGSETYQNNLQDHRGEWWIPTSQGLFQFPRVTRLEQLARTRPKAVYNTRHGLGSDDIFRLFEDRRGDIWISTPTATPPASRLTRWARATESFHHYSSADGVPDSTASAFCEDAAGNLWIGFQNGQLLRYTAGRFTRFTVVEGLTSQLINVLYADHAGRLWVGLAEQGLVRIDDPSAAELHFTWYTTADGLSSNHIWGLGEDQWGNLYVGALRRLDRLNPETNQIQHYTTADGLPTNFVQIIYRDRRGALWFGTQKGVSRFVSEPDEPAPPPPTFISAVRLAGQPTPLSRLGQSAVMGLELAANQNQIQIDFLGLSFRTGEALRYQYKLDGANQDWSALTDQRTVNYPNLSPGTYRFLVRTINADGVASPTPAMVAFRVLPPIWQRWWFLTLVAIMVGAIIYANYRYRLARLLEVERVRTRIATDLHDDIGASLSQIAILSEVVSQQVTGQTQVAEPLAQIATVSRELVDSMSDIVWAINPKRDTLRDLVHRMRRFASDVFTARDIRFQFRVPDLEPDIKMGADLRRQFFLIFKESVNNIVRHSHCAQAEIDLKMEGGWLVLTARDDGRGFDPAMTSDGHGLMSMSARAKNMGGHLELASQLGQGTTVTLRVPLTK